MEKQNPIKSTHRWQLATQPHILFPLIAAVVLAAIWGTTLLQIRDERATAERATATSSHELAELYEAQVLRALGEMDLTLKLVKYAYERGGKASVLRELNARSLLPPALLFVVSIADSKGNVVASTGRAGMPNIVGQNLAQGRDRTNAIEVNRPQQDPLTGEWTLVFSRRLDAADGSYAGIVMISVAAAYFVSGYEASKLGRYGLLAIVGTDGIFRARRSGDKVSAGGITDFQALSIHADDETKSESRIETDAWDGVRRYTSARRLYGFPLAVVVGLSADEQMAPVRRAERSDLWRAAGSSLLAILILGVMTRMGWQLARTRQRDAEELEEKVRARTQQLLETQQELEQHRVHLEQEVAERTGSLTQAQRIGHLGNWEWDVINSTVNWSDEMYRIFGYAPQQMAASFEAFLNAVHPEDRQLVNDTVSEALAEQHTYNIEHRILRPDGTLRYVHGRAEVMQGDDGKPIRMVGTLQDITERKQMEVELRASEQAYRTLAHNLPGMVYRVFVREGGRMQFSNSMPVQMTGYVADELTNGEICSIEPLILDEDRPGVMAEVKRAMAEKRSFAVEYRLKHKDGGIRWMTEHGMPVYGTDGQPLYIDGVIFDITEHKHDELELRLFRTLLDNSRDAIEVIDPATMRFLDVNQTACRELGYSREELLTMSATDIETEFTKSQVLEFKAQILQNGEGKFESTHRRKDDTTYPVEVRAKMFEIGRPYMLSIVRDITDRKLAEAELQNLHEQLRDQALRDPLTGLYNRRYLEETIERELARAARNNRPVAIVMCDLDHFKLVNDTHGHMAGDEVLRVFAELLKTHARGSDIVCRFGGEEFVMFLPDMPPAVAYQRAEKLRTELAAKRITVGAAVIQVTASFGVAAFPENGKTMDSLINAVDAAMYQAKEAGRDRIVVSSVRATQMGREYGASDAHTEIQ